MFQLRKWYLDLVTAEGTVFIGYAAEARWLGVNVKHVATLVVAGNDKAERSSGAGLVWPRIDGGVTQWSGLGVRGQWRREGEAMNATFLESAAGKISWTCHQPGGTGRLQLANGSSLEGMGYVEELEMTVKPWRMPFDTLRWGRFIGPTTNVVWIDWRKGLELTWVFVNGIPVAGRVGDERVELGVGTLEMRCQRTLREGRIIDTAWPRARWLGGLLPGGLGRARERKWLSAGVLRRARCAEEHGWCVHEVVQWR